MKNQKIHSWLESETVLARRSAIENDSSPTWSAARTAVAIAPTSISSEPTSV